MHCKEVIKLPTMTWSHIALKAITASVNADSAWRQLWRLTITICYLLLLAYVYEKRLATATPVNILTWVDDYIEHSHIPFWLSGWGRILKLPFFPSWGNWCKLHGDLVNHPLNIMYRHPSTERWNLWCQSPYPPWKCDNNCIEARFSTLMEYTPVLILGQLIVERSVIFDPPLRLKGNPPCHKQRSILLGVDIRWRIFFPAFDPRRDLVGTWGCW